MIQSTTGLIHTLAAFVALLAGAIIFFGPKGTTLHRVIGYIYVVAMLTVLASAFLLYRLTGSFNFLHVFAIIATPPLLIGLASAAFRRPPKVWLERHYHWMSWSYIGLVAALAAETSTRLIIPYLREQFGVRSRALFWLLVFGMTGVVSAVGAVLVRRNQRLTKTTTPSPRT